jgi:hypothetical protein
VFNVEKKTKCIHLTVSTTPTMDDAPCAYTQIASCPRIADDAGSSAHSPHSQSPVPTPSSSSQCTERIGGLQAEKKVALLTHESLFDGLRMLRNTIQDVSRLVFDLNATTAPMIVQVRESVEGLTEALGKLPDHDTQGTTDSTAQPATDDLRQRIRFLVQGPLASLQAEEDGRANIEYKIVQQLSRAESYLRRLLDHDGTASPPELESGSASPRAMDETDYENVGSVRSAVNDQYLSSVGDVDLLQERIMDMRDEKAQLLEEQSTREFLGLSLDDDSLQFLASVDQEEEVLQDELEYAEIGLQALKELVHDDEARQITNDILEDEAKRTMNEADTSKEKPWWGTKLASNHEALPIAKESPRGMDGALDYDAQSSMGEPLWTEVQTTGETFKNDALDNEHWQTSNLASEDHTRRNIIETLESERDEDVPGITHDDKATVPQDTFTVNAITAVYSPLRRSIQSMQVRFEHLSTDLPSTLPSTTIDKGRFIDIWFLRRLQCLPELINVYTSSIEHYPAEILPEDMIHVFMEKWFSDGSTDSMGKARESADQHSLQANMIDSQDVEQQSLSAQSLRPATVPLMRTGPHTTTKEIIAQAMRSKGISYSHSENG